MRPFAELFRTLVFFDAAARVLGVMSVEARELGSFSCLSGSSAVDTPLRSRRQSTADREKLGADVGGHFDGAVEATSTTAASTRAWAA